MIELSMPEQGDCCKMVAPATTPQSESLILRNFKEIAFVRVWLQMNLSDLWRTF